MNPLLNFPDRERIHDFLDVHPLTPDYKIRERSLNTLAALIFANITIQEDAVPTKVTFVMKCMGKEIPELDKCTHTSNLTTALIECSAAFMGLSNYDQNSYALTPHDVQSTTDA